LEFQSIDGFHDGHDVIGLYPLLSPKACWLVSLMSALGQKRTYAVQQVMSALAPIATAKADIRTRSCLLYPRKRTCAVHRLMSALGHKRTSL
jgi:hypothetical protein